MHVNKPFQSLILSQVISCFLQADEARKANLHALRTSFHKRSRITNTMTTNASLLKL